MKAGKELDKEIAEKVFGMVECDKWQPISFGSAGGMMLQKACDHESGKCWPAHIVLNINGEVGGVPKYSTDPSWNAKVLEYLEDNSVIIELSYDAAQWSGRIADGIRPSWISRNGSEWCDCKSVEHVICLLALRLATTK